jgi:hypothetical protein
MKARGGASSYRRGAAFERQVKRIFEACGYEVVRSAGSHSPVDLVAANEFHCLHIQCKRNKPSERWMLEFAAARLVRIPCLHAVAYRIDARTIMCVVPGKLQFSLGD